jgi:hypothetical protein
MAFHVCGNARIDRLPDPADQYRLDRQLESDLDPRTGKRGLGSRRWRSAQEEDRSRALNPTKAARMLSVSGGGRPAFARASAEISGLKLNVEAAVPSSWNPDQYIGLLMSCAGVIQCICTIRSF